MSAPKPVPQWDIETVASWISSIGLPAAISDAFKTNAVNGADLIALSDEDYTQSLGCTGLQVGQFTYFSAILLTMFDVVHPSHTLIILLCLQLKKIRRELEAFGIHAEAPAAPVAAAPAPIAEAPSAPPAPIAAPVPVAAPAPASTGPSAGERSALIQSELSQLSARQAEVQRGAQAYGAAQQHLRRAETELGSALKSLTITQVSGATETLQDMRIGMHGGGAFGRNRQAGRMADRHNDFGHNMVEVRFVYIYKHFGSLLQEILC